LPCSIASLCVAIYTMQFKKYSWEGCIYEISFVQKFLKQNYISETNIYQLLNAIGTCITLTFCEQSAYQLLYLLVNKTLQLLKYLSYGYAINTCTTCDVIGFKMMYRGLPYYEGIRVKTCRENKLHENKPENHTNPPPLHTFRKWSITWFQFILSGHN